MRRTLSSLIILAVVLSAGGCKKSESGAGDSAATPAAVNPLIAMQPAAAKSDPRAQIFLTRGCPQCHAISALQVVSPTSAGPDLSVAYSDVRERFSVPLDSFLQNPTGTMQIVFSAQIRLSPAERDSIYGLLRALATTSP